MTRIAFLGLGAMGSRMALHLLQTGHEVTVWNRTPERTEALRAAGAVVADTPRAATAGAEVVLAMVRDDEASQFVWLDTEAGALPALAPASVAIECSTLSVAWVRRLGALCAAAGRDFVDAPVVGSRPQAELRQLIFLAGGDASVIARVQPLLSAMGSAVHHAGTAGAGAALKLAVNGLFGVQVAAIAELIETIRRQGYSVDRAVEIIGATPVASPAMRAASGAMLSSPCPPLFPVELVEKDFRYAIATSGAEKHAPMIAAARRVFEHAIAAGLGPDNLTEIIRLYRTE